MIYNIYSHAQKQVTIREHTLATKIFQKGLFGVDEEIEYVGDYPHQRLAASARTTQRYILKPDNSKQGKYADIQLEYDDAKSLGKLNYVPCGYFRVYDYTIIIED